MQVFRVTVRGKFVGLSDQARRWLSAEASAHGIELSAFTEEGTFTYDPQLNFFNLRYEVRSAQAAVSAAPKVVVDPAAQALKEAEMFLRTLGIGHGPLRTAVMDMSAMTARHTPQA